MVKPHVSMDSLTAQFHLLRSDPEAYLALAEAYLRDNPWDALGYFSRHWAWAELGRHDLALADLDRSLRLEDHYVTRRERGKLLRERGRYAEAIAEFSRSQAMNPEAWLGGFGPLFRADCHARLGDEAAALADCATLREEHWTPGLHGAPSGSKAEVAAELRRLAAAARAASGRDRT